MMLFQSIFNLNLIIGDTTMERILIMATIAMFSFSSYAVGDIEGAKTIIFLMTVVAAVAAYCDLITSDK
jgi:hypothetical protein